MSAYGVAWAYRQQTDTLQEKFTLVTLGHLADDEGRVNLEIGEVAKLIGDWASSVEHYLARLEQAGLVALESAGDPAVYSLNYRTLEGAL